MYPHDFGRAQIKISDTITRTYGLSEKQTRTSVTSQRSCCRTHTDWYTIKKDFVISVTRVNWSVQMSYGRCLKFAGFVTICRICTYLLQSPKREVPSHIPRPDYADHPTGELTTVHPSIPLTCRKRGKRDLIWKFYFARIIIGPRKSEILFSYTKKQVPKTVSRKQ